MDADRQPRVGDAGDFAETSFPQLLLDLYRCRYDGALDLVRAKTSKRIAFQKGAAVLSESNVASETLGAQLVDQGLLEREDHERVSSHMARKHCREGVALLALELLDPKGLFLALKEQVRRRILETFAWSDGRYRLLAADALGDDIQPLRSEPLAIVREGLLNHWTPDRLLADLSGQIELFPTRTSSFEHAQRRLASGEPLAALFDRIDGTHSLGAAIGPDFNSVPALATIWILSHGHFVNFEASARESAADAAGEMLAGDIEIEVLSAATTPDAKVAAKIATAASGPAAGASAASNTAAKMRRTVIELHDNLDQRSLYELLGIGEDATDGQIRKAYFAAAKRFHPDALTHLGLSEIKQQAATVFARIAEANDVLRDPAKRADYDARGDDNAATIDTHALAQAETLFRKGEILIRMGDFRGSLEYLQPAVELWPDECEYQSTLGWALYKQPKSDRELALAHLEKAVDLDASNADAHQRLAIVLRAAGQTARGDEHLALAKIIDPTLA